MEDKKMIVVDLDGTLLNINKGCSNRTKKYLKKLKDLGYIIVIATGRVLRSAVSVTDGAEFANYVIACSGAVIYDMDNSRIVDAEVLPKDTVKSICDNYNKEEMQSLNLSDLFYHNRYMESENHVAAFERRIGNIETFLDKADDIYNITMHVHDNKYIKKYCDMLEDKNLEILVMQDSYSDKQCIEIFNKGVSKYVGINKVMELEDISNDNVIAFGDGLNDVDMIKLSGTGVAMGNALNSVKKVSDYITISHNNDGVVYFLKLYLKENNLFY